ncbi:HAMP domain-containing sensor histidine kinase [Marinivivus vitaminiproducens]|uniref:HAMP domain-containing sensor histidine kinase n=1 Tax=Marinivivus vitaminiproducens TaxID=3035935 RepID=UPI0027A43F0B|nr:HAMP domain-containing sensor histidine kinase [Geminicoccaceae bacterium SCSIO 64248]
MSAFAMPRPFAHVSVFTCLLVNTTVSSLIVAVVSVACLQRVADEHPRRYLSKTLFDHVASSMSPEELRREEIDGNRFEVYPLDQLPRRSDLPVEDFIQAIADDPDGVATAMYGDHYIAATIHDGYLIVLPRFGRMLSAQARVLIAVVVVTIVLVTALNYLTIRWLTSPFSVFKSVTRNVDDNNLSYRVPIERTYGEFRDLAQHFNGMLQRIDHVATARRNMLLAIPHELRTPLARLKVRKDLIADADVRADIAGDIQTLEDLLNVILESERLQTNEGKVNRTAFVLGDVVRNVLCSIGERRREIAVKDRLRGKLAFADAFLIQLLVTNLVTNALRYGRKQPITITLSEDAASPGTLLLRVSDRGVGIPADQIPMMTEPFWRQDESRQRMSGGYGLGLYLCKRIVTSHDGILEIDSTVGEGTSVTAHLPRALREAAERPLP